MNLKQLLRSVFSYGLICFDLFLVFYLFVAAPCLASVIKTNGDLELVLEKEPLFSSTKVWLPGESQSTTILFTNKAKEGKKIIIRLTNLEGPEPIVNQIAIEFNQGTKTLYKNCLKEMNKDGEVILENIPGGGKETLTINLIFDSTAGNKVQGQKVTFGLQLGLGEDGSSAVQDKTSISKSASESSSVSSPIEVLGITSGIENQEGNDILSQSQTGKMGKDLKFRVGGVLLFLTATVVLLQFIKRRTNSK